MNISITQQGELVKISPSIKRAVFPHVLGRGNRGVTTKFTNRSRKNLMEKFAVIDQKRAKHATFITLTYVENYQDHSNAYMHIREFTRRLLQHGTENTFIVWKKEVQSRGAIHFHLMAWNLPYIHKAQVAYEWKDISGSYEELSCSDGTIEQVAPFTRIEYCNSRRKTWYYLSKYVGKETESDVVPDSDIDQLFDEQFPLENLDHRTKHPDARVSPAGAERGFNYGSNLQNAPKKSTGRWWGWVNRKAIPLADLSVTTIEMTFEEYRRLRWDLRYIMPHTIQVNFSHQVKMFWFWEEIVPALVAIQGINGDMALGWKRRVGVEFDRVC